jgi:hypothetical protein
MNIDSIIGREIDGRTGASMTTNERSDWSKVDQRLQRKLEQLRDAQSLWTVTSDPLLPYRLAECLKAGDLVEAERVVTEALTLINGARNCLSCDT